MTTPTRQLPRSGRLRALIILPLLLIGTGWGLFLLCDGWFPLPMATLHRQSAMIVTDRDGTPLRIFLPNDEQLRIPVTLHDVAPVFVRALIASEDRWFYHHLGVNPFAIVRALASNIRHGKVVSGASTIPMQIARMAEPKARTLWSKGWEVFRALQLEWHLSKDQLLELYLNLTPYGGNIEGIGAATHVYFGKTPAQLSLGEAALLAVLPRAPNSYNPVRNPAAAVAIRNRVLRQLARRAVFPESAVADALRHPLPTIAWRAPLNAPHFCQLVRDRLPQSPRLLTTLDQRVQTTAEEQMTLWMATLRDRGVGSAAAVVIENDTRAVRALVGSPNFFEEAYNGQVNGATARRSPGSTLKPFLYAMAMDAGLVIPDSYVLDIPTDFSGYVPENYDGLYHGRVTMRDALVQSLNAPAVRLLNTVGIESFHRLLQRGGLTTLDRPPATYGLPLILGSGEVSLLDLTNLYATLAVGGEHHPIQIQPGMVGPGDRLFSQEAVALTAGILTGLQRPDLPRAWRLTRDAPAVAWKTGTSYGHRDAWSIGFSSRYTIGVWVGNFDGRGHKGLAGSEYAAPLLFALFRAVEGGSTQIARPHDTHLGTVKVCTLSHELAGPFCPVSESVTMLAGRSKLIPCSYHRRLFVDTETGDQLAGSCLAARPHHAEVVTVYPPELTAWWQVQGQSQPPLPRLSPLCNDVPDGTALTILSPAPTTPYRRRRDAPAADQKIPLRTQVGTTSTRLYWYQDGKLVATGTPATTLLLPLQVGAHRLTVVDNTGRVGSTVYRVE
ncbi:MAG: penicillin-binding protein 1C [Deltaproteobacteria bacterium]|nr:penicillin-binding protein 1C [Deltaproteobacteria bacterium]